MKVEHTRAFAAEVILAGEGFDEAKAHGFALVAERKLTLVHPYDERHLAHNLVNVADVNQYVGRDYEIEARPRLRRQVMSDLGLGKFLVTAAAARQFEHFRRQVHAHHAPREVAQAVAA